MNKDLTYGEMLLEGITKNNMKETLKIYVRCTNCNMGNEEYAEQIMKKDVTTEETRTNRMSYDITAKQLGDLTISQFVAQRKCKNCQKKALIEIE